MSSTEEGAIISFPIKLQAGDVGGQKPITNTPAVETETLEKLQEFIQNTDQKGLQTLAQFSKNPGGMVENKLLGVLGKAGIHGAIATAIIAAVLSSPEVIRAVVESLAVKGGPLNQDFHRFFSDESQIGLARDLQYRRAVGLDVIITNEDRGFLLSDPAFVNNSLVDVEETRAIRISSKESQYGYVTGM